MTWSVVIPFFCFVSGDQFSYQRMAAVMDGDQDTQNREVGDDGYEEVYEEIDGLRS